MTGADRSDRHPSRPGLVVYGTGWCPDVQRSRALLDAAGVAYHYVDLDQDKDAVTLVPTAAAWAPTHPHSAVARRTFLVEPTDEDLRNHLTGREAESGRTSADPSA